MKKRVSNFLLLFFCCHAAIAQCSWFKTFDPGYNESQEPWGLMEQSNSIYILLFGNNNYPPITRNGILKFDENGTFLWKTTAYYPPESSAGSIKYFPRDFIADRDSFLYFFSSSTNSNQDKEFLINKFDKNGAFIWFKTIGIDGENLNRSEGGLELAPDSLGLILTGRTDDGAYVIIRTDSSGNTLWKRVIQVPVSGKVGYNNPVVRMPDNSFKIAYDNDVLTDYRDYLGSLDSLGNPQYFLPNPFTGKAIDLALHPNGNLVYLSSEENPPMFENGGMRIQMLTPGFDTVWSYLYFDTQFPYIFLQGFVRNLSISPDGKILASAYNGGNNMHLVCLSPQGQLLWKREIAIEGEVEAGYTSRKFNHAIWTSDGCILVDGYIYGSHPENGYQSRLFLLKLDSTGCLDPGCQQTIITSTRQITESADSCWTIFPNPAGQNISIQLSPECVLASKIKSVFLIDNKGIVLAEKTLQGNSTLDFSIKSQSGGICYVYATDGRAVVLVKKIIIN